MTMPVHEFVPESERTVSAPRLCRVCGASIDGLRPQARSCSDACRARGRRQDQDQRVAACLYAITRAVEDLGASWVSRLPATELKRINTTTTDDRGEVEMTGDALPRFLTADEVGALLRTTRKAVYVMAERRLLPGVTRLGRRILFRSDVLLHWLDQKSTPSPKE
jgi:hypothetical protein